MTTWRSRFLAQSRGASPAVRTLVQFFDAAAEQRSVTWLAWGRIRKLIRVVVHLVAAHWTLHFAG